MERRVRTVLLIAAAAFAAPALGFLLAPTTFASFVDLEVRGPTGSSDVRAVMGGVGVGVALFLAWCSLSRARWPTGLLALQLVLGAMLLGRALSLASDGVTLRALLLGGGELVLFALGSWAAWQARAAGSAVASS